MVANVAVERAVRSSVLATPGGLLRAWRTELGWTQDDVARTVRVSRAAVTSWETDARRIPAQALADLDFAYVAGGCLVDLARALASPPRSGDGGWPAGPRRNWGHVFTGPPGPAWAWVRPAAGDRVSGYSRSGLLGLRFDEVTGPDGIFLVEPQASPRWPLRVTLSEPGWVEFGRGPVPSWLECPVKTTAGLADAEVILTPPPVIAGFVQQLRDRDRGAPETLRDRLRVLVGAQRWDQLEAQLRRPAPPGDDGPHTAWADPRPPQTARERMVVHRRLREARAMSQADAAAAVTALLADANHPRAGQVTRQQVRNYEEGRASRVRYLPALLDMVYGASGWSCWEPVRVTRTGSGEFEAAFPGWWAGPIGVTAIPSGAFPCRGRLTLTSRDRMAQCPLPVLGDGTGITVGQLRMPGEPPLCLRVPPGWRLQANMGHRAGAIDADAAWSPVDAAAASQLFRNSVEGWLRLIGRTQADLDRALGIAPGS